MGLRTLLDTHFHVDGVAHHVDIGGVNAREDITIIIIIVVYGIIVLEQTFVHELLVIDIAALHAQHGIEVVGVDHRITCPRNVSEVIFLTFIDTEQYANMLLVNIPHRILQDGSIAESQLVIPLYQVALGFGITLWSEFLLGLEQVLQLTSLMERLQGTLGEELSGNLTVAQLVVTLNDDMLDAHFVFLIDIDVENNLVLARDIITLADVDLGILIAFVVEVFLG